MSDLLTEAELTEIEELADRATDLPWREHGGWGSCVKGGPRRPDGQGEYTIAECAGSPSPRADMAYIAAACNLAPRLVAEVRRLQAIAQASQKGA